MRSYEEVFANFGIISGFLTVGITGRLRISGLGPKRYHVIPANLLDYHMMYFLNEKHDYLEGRRTSLYGARISNKVQK